MNPPGTKRGGLYHVGIRADFVYDVIHSLAGGVNELDSGRACTSDEAAAGLVRKYEAADDGKTRDVSLWLTEEEAMCLGCAGINCATNGLPPKQRERLEAWHAYWLEWIAERRPDLFESAELSDTMAV